MIFVEDSLLEESEINLNKNSAFFSEKAGKTCPWLISENFGPACLMNGILAESFLSCFAMFLKNWLKFIPAELFLFKPFFANNETKWIAAEKSSMSAVGHSYKSVASDVCLCFCCVNRSWQISVQLFFNCGSNEVNAIHLTYLPRSDIPFCIADLILFA